MAIIGFTNVHPMKIKKLCEDYKESSGIMECFHSEKDIVLFVMDGSMGALTEKLYNIMDLVEEKPSIYITQPMVERHEVAIPDRVLEEVYGDLPDRRFRV